MRNIFQSKAAKAAAAAQAAKEAKIASYKKLGGQVATVAGVYAIAGASINIGYRVADKVMNWLEGAPAPLSQEKSAAE